MSKKLTPKHILEALDRTLIATGNGLFLYYFHSAPRGFYIQDRNLQLEGLFPLGPSMKKAAEEFNSRVKKAAEKYKPESICES